MLPLFLACFLAGLLLGVFAMLHGVDRRSAKLPFNVVVEPSATLNVPLVAAFVTFFGAIGYVLTRYTTLGALGRVAIATLVGAGAALGALALIQKWAIPGAREERIDERFLLQGHPARVSAPIDGHTPGAIVYEIDGMQHAARALALDCSTLDAETDVVIERVENGLAYVEPWERVEQRL
jgi:hypothetical protein